MSRPLQFRGMSWEGLVIDWLRIWRSNDGPPHRVVEVKVPQERGPEHKVSIYVSPSGRSVRVFRDGRELK